MQSIDLIASLLSAQQVQLRWRITNPTKISALQIYRAEDAAQVDFKLIASPSKLAVGYVDNAVAPNKRYSYFVKTLDVFGNATLPPSNKAAITTGEGAPSPTPTPPTSPTPSPTPVSTPSPTPVPTPSATPSPTPSPSPSPTPVANTEGPLSAIAISPSQIKLTWELSGVRNSNVKVYRAEGPELNNFLQVTTPPLLRNYFVNSGLKPNTTYSYYIRWALSGSGIILSAPSNTVTVRTPGDNEATPTPTPTPSPTPTATPTATPTPGPTPAGTPTPAGAIPLDGEEAAMVRLLAEYRGMKYLGPLRPSIALTKSSDFLSKDLAQRGIVSKTDALGRDVETRARAFGFQPQTRLDAVVAAGNLTAQQALNVWKSSYADNEILITQEWRVAGVGRSYNAAAGKWYWVIEFAGTWDKTIPIPGEDEDGMVDGNPLIRTRPPGWAIAAGHRFTGYGEDYEWYSSVHCDRDDPEKYCWKDEPPQGNPSLSEPSLRENLPSIWHVQYTISPTGVKHYNDYNGWDGTGFTITWTINADGAWKTQGYRAYQQPTPNESGTWTSVHDAARDEEIVTFTRQGGRPAAVIRIHAARGVLTLYAVEGGAAMQSFLKGWPADNNPQDDPQVILHPGPGYFNAPHAPFPGQHRCNFCP